MHFYRFQSQKAIEKITANAQFVGDWVVENGLKLNLNKTKAMMLGSRKNLNLFKQDQLQPIVINGVVIPYSESTKCLGVHITDTLS